MNNFIYILSTDELHFIYFSFPGAHSVEIRELSVPSMVEYKSEDSVVLDCDYDMGEEDKARNPTIPHIIIVF